MTVETPVRSLRADAQRNRDKLLTAAVEAFAEEGEDVALETIATRAGVGIGTLYRHFPSRDALVAAAYRNEVDALCSAAADFVSSLPADVEPIDVIRVINGIWYLPNGPEWRADVGRMLDLVIDGLRYGCPFEPADVDSGVCRS